MQLSELKDWTQELRPHLAPLAAAFGALTGAAVFFSLTQEPWWGWGLLPVGLGLILGGFSVWRPLSAVAWGIVITGLVFCLSAWQVARVDFVDFQAAQKSHWLTGRVIEVKTNPDKPNRATLVLDRIETYGLGEAIVLKANIGVYVSQIRDVNIGDTLALPVVLLAPEGPKYKGQRDGRLWKFFNGGSVNGYVVGSVEPTWRPEPEMTITARAGLWLDEVRQRIFEESDSYAGGAVAALLIGNEDAVLPDLRDAYRETGLSHLLAISGMQLTLVAMSVYGLLRWLGALVPWVALRVNVRLYAAVAALLATWGYTFLAGASVSLVRATIMASIVLVAVISGRLKSALRGWCAAVVLVLMVSPVMVTRAGFLLSISAVLGLILLAMAEQDRWQGGKISSYLRGLVLATVVAGCATAPVLVGIFGQYSVIGMIANVIAVPIMAIATYLGMIVLILWPFGIENYALIAMSAVVEQVNSLAYWLSSYEYANVTVDKGLWWVVAIFAVVVMVAIYIQRWLEAAVALGSLVMIMLVAAVTMPKPDLMIWDAGRAGLKREGDSYRMLWAENLDNTVRLAKLARVKLVGDTDVAETVDDAYMPVTDLESFAWAERNKGVWVVKPFTCGRIWQKLAGECWVDE